MEEALADSRTAVDPKAVRLPDAKPISIGHGITIQPPLTRRGHGPPILLLADHDVNLSDHGRTLDPPPLLKWAEEGFCVAQMQVQPALLDADLGEAKSIAAQVLLAALEVVKRTKCEPKDKVGLVVYSANAGELLEQAALAQVIPQVEIIVCYGSHSHDAAASLPEHTPVVAHLPGSSKENAAYAVNASSSTRAFHEYPSASTHFAIPSHEHYSAGAANLAHSRSLLAIKRALGGPYFDLEAIWDEHTALEFGERSVEKTMGTMVAEPYVNHVPTMTGGVGREALTAFYRDHFIFGNPADTRLELVSRTTGHDRIVDEFLFCCTHDRDMDWLVPGIPPTGKELRIPFTSVVNVRGDRLFHEHIAWDQATVLKQLGLLPDWLPFPYPLADGRTPSPGKRFEYHLPVAGVESAEKLMDESAVPSNGMFGYAIREVDIP